MDKQAEKILITGPTGLVGFRLLPRLTNAGWDCRAMVRSRTQTLSAGTSVEADLLDRSSLAEVVSGVSAIVHLAAVFRTNDTEQIWRVNLEGTQNLLEAAKQFAPQARFIMASTAHVYDATGGHPGREDDLCKPAHAYPASKLAAEHAVRESGLNWCVLRFPFIYGDRDGHIQMLPEHVLDKWHPATRMSVIHHLDIANAVQMALEGKMDGRIVNLSDDSPVSVYELLQMVGVRMQSSSEPLTNPWYLQVDSVLARSLGFEPEIRTVYQALQQNLL